MSSEGLLIKIKNVTLSADQMIYYSFLYYPLNSSIGGKRLQENLKIRLPLSILSASCIMYKSQKENHFQPAQLKMSLYILLACRFSWSGNKEDSAFERLELRIIWFLEFGQKLD